MQPTVRCYAVLWHGYHPPGRFGYFDESFYPAFCEDDDFVMRLSLMKPPGVIKILKDVFVVHGPRRTKTYIRCGQVTQCVTCNAKAAPLYPICM